MMTRCIFAWMIAAAMSIVTAQEESTATGKTFKIVCNFKNDEVAQAALDTAEAVWPFAQQIYGASLSRPKDPLVLKLYRKQEDTAAAVADLSGDKFQFDATFIDEATKTAHATLLPNCSGRALRQFGLLSSMRRAIARDAAALLATYAQPNRAKQPNWMSRGAAWWISNQTVVKMNQAPAFEKDPFIGGYIHVLALEMKKGELPSTGTALLEQFTANQSGLRDAEAMCLFQFLMSKPAYKFDQVLAKARALPKDDELTKTAVGILTKITKIETLDADYRAWLKALAPPWREVTSSFTPVGPAFRQAAGAEANAIAWNTKSIQKPNFTISGELTILDGNEKQLNIHFAGQDTGFMMLGLDAGNGLILNTYDGTTNNWTELATADSQLVRANEKFSFSITVGDGLVLVKIDNVDVMKAEIRQRNTTGLWGLGALAGSAGTWESLKLKE